MHKRLYIGEEPEKDHILELILQWVQLGENVTAYSTLIIE